MAFRYSEINDTFRRTSPQRLLEHLDQELVAAGWVREGLDPASIRLPEPVLTEPAEDLRALMRSHGPVAMWDWSAQQGDLNDLRDLISGIPTAPATSDDSPSEIATQQPSLVATVPGSLTVPRNADRLETVAANTFGFKRGIDVEVSFDDGATWQACLNGQPIPGLEEHADLTGKTMLVRARLTTGPGFAADTVLRELRVEVEGAAQAVSELFDDEQSWLTGELDAVAVQSDGSLKLVPQYTDHDFSALDAGKWQLAGSALVQDDWVRLSYLATSTPAAQGWLKHVAPLGPWNIDVEFDVFMNGNQDDYWRVYWACDTHLDGTVTEGYFLDFDPFETAGEVAGPARLKLGRFEGGTEVVLAQAALPFALNDSVWRRARLTVESGWVRVRIDDAPRMSFHIEDYAPQNAMFGFQGGSGSHYNENRVRNVRIFERTQMPVFLYRLFDDMASEDYANFSIRDQQPEYARVYTTSSIYSSADAQIRYPDIGPIDPTRFTHLAVRYRWVSGTVRPPEVFFTNARRTSWNNDQRVIAADAYIADGEWHTMYIDLTSHQYWEHSDVTGIRFDWTDQRSHEMDLSWVRLQGPPGSAGDGLWLGPAIDVSAIDDVASSRISWKPIERASDEAALECWYMPDAGSYDSWIVPVWIGPFGSTDGRLGHYFSQSVRNTSSTAQMRFYKPDGGYIEASNIGTFPNRMRHLVGTVTPEATKLYLDGQLIAEGAGDDLDRLRGAPLFVGSGPNGQNPAHGRYGPVALYPKALSAEEVQELYVTGRPLADRRFAGTDRIDYPLYNRTEEWARTEYGPFAYRHPASGEVLWFMAGFDWANVNDDYNITLHLLLTVRDDYREEAPEVLYHLSLYYLDTAAGHEAPAYRFGVGEDGFYALQLNGNAWGGMAVERLPDGSWLMQQHRTTDLYVTPPAGVRVTTMPGTTGTTADSYYFGVLRLDEHGEASYLGLADTMQLSLHSDRRNNIDRRAPGTVHKLGYYLNHPQLGLFESRLIRRYWVGDGQHQPGRVNEGGAVYERIVGWAGTHSDQYWRVN